MRQRRLRADELFGVLAASVAHADAVRHHRAARERAGSHDKLQGRDQATTRDHYSGGTKRRKGLEPIHASAVDELDQVDYRLGKVVPIHAAATAQEGRALTHHLSRQS